MNNNPNKLDPQQIVAEFKDIPPMPNVMVKALNVIKNPASGIAELSKIMQIDQAISTKTLSLVNSAFYGFRQQITSINKALVVLGMMKAKNIIMSLALKQMMTAQGSRELWEHSIKCAVAAEILAKEASGDKKRRGSSIRDYTLVEELRRFKLDADFRFCHLRLYQDMPKVAKRKK